ncbi:MAG: ribosome recycling factor [Chloroflexota bacterium]|nr:ribosome recycling factor [Chloroflexota bacterium]MDE2886236.1 ribosome recycling factor [Chloroflexota bacterium]
MADTNEEVELILMDAAERMDKSVEVLRHEADTIRTGRANVAMLDSVRVELYGTAMPLNQVATVNAPDARLLVVQPFDRSTLGTIEKELMRADLGLTPSNDGTVIRLPIPMMTQERRQEMVRRLHRLREDAHVAIRNVRRDALDHLRGLEKNKEISQDELRREQDQLQKITDEHIVRADQVNDKKEAELMEV